MQDTTGQLADLVSTVADKHRDDRGPLLPILHDLQYLLGYIPPEVVGLVATELNLSRADVHGVVTFYKDFRAEPVGRVCVQVCRAEACRSVDSEQLAGDLEQWLGTKTGQTTPDGRITLDQVFCVGNCALGPSALINGQVYGRLDRDRVAQIVLAEEE
ncbi:NAD(P)H-dependent oxidoreductase subunit E [Nocardia sp. NPDC058640]|uniref:NADH-quinone oxidoreductase subunit NuoE family protein n=1 Tax=Nocardia sp. NPDC058640 TaxID=3346571 RepID=UPI00365FEFEE